MQQATYWFNNAKWEEEKRQKAVKDQEESLAMSQAKRTIRDLQSKVEDLTERLSSMEKAHMNVAREVTALQRVVLDKD